MGSDFLLLLLQLFNPGLQLVDLLGHVGLVEGLNGGQEQRGVDS